MAAREGGPDPEANLALANAIQKARDNSMPEDNADEGGQWQVTTEPADLAAVRGALDDAGFAYSSAELTMVPRSTVKLDEKDARQLLRLIDALEENDDVQDVAANFDISEEVL